jgi:hypothetical protein
MRALLIARSLVLLAVVALCGCTQEERPATAIAISVTSDLGAELDQVTFRVYRGSDLAFDGRPAIPEFTESWERVQSGAYVIEKGTTNELVIAVAGYSATGALIVERREGVQFISKQTRALRVFLAAACRDRVCPPAETCSAASSATGSVCEQVSFAETIPVLKPGDELVSTLDGGAELGEAGAGSSRDGRVSDAERNEAGVAPGSDAQLAQDAHVADARAACMPSRDGGVCNVVEQCGCDSPMQHCQVRDNAPAPACVPIVGMRSANEECGRDDDCKKGLDCVGSVCRKYCKGPDDCKGDCIAIPSERGELPERVCVEACDLGTKCGDTGVSCVPRKDDAPGTGACLLPALTCTENRICEEPVIGNGTCATTTDKRDCCPKISGMMTCELVSSCGCQMDKACQLSGPAEALMTSCIEAGMIERGRQCMRDSDCKKGLGCWDGLCAKYCEADAECGMGGRCTARLGPSATPIAGLKYCRDACTYDGNKGCTPPAVCARFANYEAFCFLSRDPCLPPYDRAGVCDVTERVCKQGTDPDDCGAR